MTDRLAAFIAGMEDLVATRPTESDLLPACGALLERLVAHDDWLAAPFDQSHPDHYCQYLLHCDSDKRFSVVCFVWGPGQETPIHDHRVWGAIGMLRGAEKSTSFTTGTEGLVEGSTGQLEPGKVEFVSPRIGDIHRVSNALAHQDSISIHVYGTDIGAVERRVYDPVTGEASPFISGYTPLPST